MRSPVDAIRAHWPEYLIEAAGLGLFMVSAVFVTTAFEYPNSLLHAALPDPTIRRVLIGICMGLTAIGIIYSPWGQQSGAHLNPAVTLTFFRLGKLQGTDAFLYVVSQTLGGLLGVWLSAGILGMAIQHPTVNYAVTTPGSSGVRTAFVAEATISFGLMLMVLFVSNHRRFNIFTGLTAGCLVAAYISIEAPISGMSMNPARTFASALPAHLWTGFWLYLTAPPLGMLLAAEVYVRAKSLKQVYCAKLHHQNSRRCIFRCNYLELLRADTRSCTADRGAQCGRPKPSS